MRDPSPPEVLELSDLTITRPDGEVLLHQASLTLRAGETVILVGPTGCGKSTLLRLLAGLLRPNAPGWEISGQARYGERTYDLSREVAPLGAMVFQDHALLDDLSVRENLEIAARPEHGERSGEAARLAGELTARLPPEKSVASLSGGQKQQVSIARTLLAGRPLLLIDEPNAALDVASSRQLAEIIATVQESTGKPQLITAHHMRALLPVADRVIFFNTDSKSLVELEERDADTIEGRLQAAGQADVTAAAPSGSIAGHGKLWWSSKFFLRYLWILALSPEALIYMALGGVLVGFVTTWFTFRHFPLADYLTPLFHAEVLGGIGFAQYRILVPLVVAMLLASRAGAIIAAETGHRVLTQQFEALKNLGVAKELYLTASVLLAAVLAGLFFTGLVFVIAAVVSQMTWAQLFPKLSIYFWQEHFFDDVLVGASLIFQDAHWVFGKAFLSATVIALISLGVGRLRKASVLDLNRAISLAVVASLAVVLALHTAIAFLEF